VNLSEWICVFLCIDLEGRVNGFEDEFCES